jgi:DNA replication licensing factor MCM2
VNLPLSDRLRDLRQSDLNSLVKVCGVVTRRTGVFPQLLAIAYDCVTCTYTMGPYFIRGGDARPDLCLSCKNKGPFRINHSKTVYGNFQRLTLQETPGTVPPGRVPRHKEVTVLDDLIDVARPGEEVDITGIFTIHSNQKLSRKTNGFPIFNTVIEANCIQKKSGGSDAMWTEEDKRKILALSKDPRVSNHSTSIMT